MPPTQGTTNNPALNDFIGKLEVQIINPIITLLALAAFVVFVWGVVGYIQNAANDEKRAQGQQHILWGIVGLALLFGAAAIANVLKNVAASFG
jgi:TRAP-type C4-dicarboxylate transport system permease small subunit